MTKESKSKNFYITTTLPYVNGEAHIGHALEFVRADVIARKKKLDGYDVFFGTGTDEHGSKIERNATSLHMTPKDFVDKVSVTFKNILVSLGISPDIHFIRTTDKKHVDAAQEFWKICKKNGFIYKKNYKIKYCVGCELEKTDSELVHGKCSIHPSLPIEEIDEENYFFKFSEFQRPLLDFYEKNPNFVIPDFRFNEIKNFVKNGLNDFSISRLKSKMSWGIEVPDDKEHVMYVWFDALVSYIANIGWPNDKESFNKWWNSTSGVVQYCGKDNLRQQSAMWQSMLFAAGLPNSKQIVINGFVTGEGGIKMSKSIGNVIDPLEIIKEYGTDALRYFVLREIHPFEDSPFTLEKFKESYNAHLANGLGNLVSRVMKMAETYDVKLDSKFIPTDDPRHDAFYATYEINKVCDDIWLRIQHADKFIQDNEPFKTIKTDEVKGREQISYLLKQIAEIAHSLKPILPQTAEKISQALKDNKIEAPLFMRK